KDVVNTIEITKKTDRTKEIRKQDIPEEIEKLKALMKIASDNLDFEKCIEIRDTITKLKIKMRK
ncbi:MAG: UvrB/UvrC motif-containing protein, partial [Clostridia bacterium]|nr:UvrB/UvrC motif-containing protein [Clostridia bacterium]